MSEVEIRWANDHDWHDLGFVHFESYRNAYKGIIPDDFFDIFTREKQEKYYQKSLSEGIEKIALMFVDNNAIGCIIVGKCRDDDLDDMYGEIWGIYLLKDYWGKGFGKRLINWGTDRIRELGYYKASLWVLKENTNARRFYEHLGFLFDGTERLITRGQELVQVRYQRTFA
jgi:ribosomal protein S18 acetylase RimI-like enzyme